MQRDHPPHPKKSGPPFGNRGGNHYMNIPVAPAVGAVLPPAAKPPMPFKGAELRPSEVCPKNFIILDQTCHRSQIMFHPASAHKFGGPSLNFCGNYIQDIFERKDVADIKREISSSLKEDSDDIDALLSLEEEEEEDYDDEEVSTARTVGNYRSYSPDPVSSYASRHQKNKSSSKLCSTGNSNIEQKQQKMKKMVKVLRGIVPGADQMNTVAVLDEAVKYLKSLKVEVQKLGVGNFKN
ncbi:transcription factor bHLH144-like [Mangifera indica]|uniref:transcription factor bHLH144-like n=1 Tax=Mangifera indica TaxID=29780 RepID=UPI001CFA3F6E|nr:transcription factor bHLH144-like [Mangifera indica]